MEVKRPIFFVASVCLSDGRRLFGGRFVDNVVVASGGEKWVKLSSTIENCG
jgi:hypothetical protein